MEIRIEELAAKISGTVIGNKDIVLTSVAPLEDAGEGQVALLLDQQKRHAACSSKASAIIVPEDYSCDGQNIIRVKNPRQVLPIILTMFEPRDVLNENIHDTAVIAKTASIGPNVTIAPYCVVGEYACIAEGSVLYPHVTIGAYTQVGSFTKIYSGVSIYHHCIIGNNVIIHSGAVIGSDGFGFVPQGKQWVKVPQIGHVIVEDDVEIGANTAIDRGAIGDTVIGAGTKIDNLVHVAHNTKLGKSCAIAGQVGFAGSTILGDNVSAAGQAGFGGHITVGSGTTVLGKAGVTKDIRENQIVSGFPARDHKEEMLFTSRLRRLPAAVDKIKKILSQQGVPDETL